MAARLPDAIRRSVIEMYQSERIGATTVAKEFGLGSSTTVYRILQEAGIPRKREDLRKGRPGLGRFEDNISQEIATKYAGGVSLQALAKEYNCTHGPIRRAVKMFGDGLRNRGKKVRSFTTQQIAEMKTMVEDGASLTAIGERYGAHSNTVGNALRLHGIVLESRGAPYGERHGSWRGGVSVMHGGYVSELLPRNSPFMAMANTGGRVMQHRLEMAKRLGRPLREDETVHHINGNRQDNRLSNLELRQGKHGKHVVYCCADCGSRNVVPVKLK